MMQYMLLPCYTTLASELMNTAKVVTINGRTAVANQVESSLDRPTPGPEDQCMQQAAVTAYCESHSKRVLHDAQ